MKRLLKATCSITDLVVSTVFLQNTFYATDKKNNVVFSNAAHNMRSITVLIPQSLQLQAQVSLG
jgi:hypothetical protein